MEVKRFDVFLVTLDPTTGSEIKKTRPCVVISPNEMNGSIRTVIVAPMTSKIREYPTRSTLTFHGQEGQVILDQIRAIDKKRLIKRLGKFNELQAKKVIGLLQEMFAW